MAKFLSYLDSRRLPKFSAGRGESLLHNKIVLYLVFAASLIQLFVLANTGRIMAAASFIIIAAVMLYFSRNMVVVLVCALAISSILGIFGEFRPNRYEGMKGKDDEDKDEKKDEKEKKKDDKHDKKLMDDLKNQGEELISTQEKIMKNFEKISPEIDKVEGLVDKINATAAELSPNLKGMFEENLDDKTKKK